MMYLGILLGFDVARRRQKKSEAATGVKGAQGFRKRKRQIEKRSRKQNRGK